MLERVRVHAFKGILIAALARADGKRMKPKASEEKISQQNEEFNRSH